MYLIIFVIILLWLTGCFDLLSENFTNYIFYDENGNQIDHSAAETVEQLIAEKYIEKDSTVLELGARYGTVSAKINKALSNKQNQVSVEPDSKVIEALTRNRDGNDCEFQIVYGMISNKKMSLSGNSYGLTSDPDESSNIPIYSIDELQRKFNVRFDTLVADCEGCLFQLMKENPFLYTQLKMITFEQDYAHKGDYSEIIRKLKENGFSLIASFPEDTNTSLKENAFHTVWKRF